MPMTSWRRPNDMSLVTSLLRQKLGADLAPGSLWCVALSGGLDSSMLLYGMSQLRTELAGVRVRAVHIDHGLHEHSADWAAHCREVCERLDVPLQTAVVEVDARARDGLESAARRARYDFLARTLERDEVLLTGHHQDDQVETVLLRLLRGSGIPGLSGIADRQPFGNGLLLRPLLDLSRAELRDDAESIGINWIEDPTNTDTAFDRNYLRHEVLPRLKQRWPGLGRTIGRSARLASESSGLLDALAEADGRNVVAGTCLDADGLRQLDPPRQRNVVRHLLRSRGLQVPGEVQLKAGLDQLLSARTDGQPLLRWPHGQIRRYRDRLHVLDFDPDGDNDQTPGEYQWDGQGTIDLGTIRGRLSLEPQSSGISRAIVSGGLAIRFRRGGERIRPEGHLQSQSLKKLFQARGIVPWMRAHVPLVYAGDRLIAVADLWLAAEAVQENDGFRLTWAGHAAIE